MTKTFQEMSDKYLRFNQANSDTKAGYKRILKRYWLPVLSDEPIDTISYEMLMDCILDIEVTAKTLNNILVPLRGVFDLAYKLGHIQTNPMSLVFNKKVQTELPDPFTKEEMGKLLDWLKTNEEFYYQFYLFMFWTGLRPSEAFALRWTDVKDNIIYIHRSRVRGVEKSVTKTHVARLVYLNKHSQQALDMLRQYHDDYIMICPTTGLPFYNEKPPRVRLQQAMKATGVRIRPAYNTRHTYATMMLMSGLNPSFVANQLGHSLPMMMKRYARWINSEKDLLEMSKLVL